MTDDNARGETTTRPARRDAARKKAQDHFAASERRDTEVRKEIERQHNAALAQMSKLRALRLEKEEADRVAAANAPAPERPTRRRKVKA